MRQILDYPLWLGHVGDARDVRAVLSAEIRAVVDLAADELPVVLPRDLVYHRFPLVDGPGNPPWLLRSAIATVADLLRAGIPTLLYCSAGMSRTPVIAAGALAQVLCRPFAETLAIIAATGPTDVSPGLSADVQATLA